MDEVDWNLDGSEIMAGLWARLIRCSSAPYQVCPFIAPPFIAHLQCLSFFATPFYRLIIFLCCSACIFAMY